MRVKLGGHWWTIRVVKRILLDGKECWGKCWHNRRLITIAPHFRARKLLDTYLHEAIHAIRPELAEHAVTELATDLAGLVYDKLGYRQVID